MTKFKNKYRIESTRLQSWDYGSNGAYFITIVTKNREHFFGKIVNGEMLLSDIGKLAEKFWLEIPQHFPFIELANFVVMPDHTHGILIIKKSITSTPKLGVPTVEKSTVPTVEKSTVPTVEKSTVAQPQTQKSKNGGPNEKWKPNTIGSIINQYKRVVTINARKINTNFAWQPRFHDHIIRNARSFENIQNYIANNPVKWEMDNR